MINQFRSYPLREAEFAEGVVVVVDVLRAFTTAAHAFERGASQIYPVATLEDAFRLREQIPNALLMGEVDGIRPDGFDFGNSPAALQQTHFQGRPIIHRTSAGTQGLVRAAGAKYLLAASFVVAKATARYLQELKPKMVSFVITGEYADRDGEEDWACAEYIVALLKGHSPFSETFTARVETSTIGRDFLAEKTNYLSQKDFQLSMDADRFDFYLQVRKLKNRLVMERAWI